MWTARISQQGQATIPKEVRKILGIKEGEMIAFTQNGDNIVIQKATVVLENEQK